MHHSRQSFHVMHKSLKIAVVYTCTWNWHLFYDLEKNEETGSLLPRPLLNFEPAEVPDTDEWSMHWQSSCGGAIGAGRGPNREFKARPCRWYRMGVDCPHHGLAVFIYVSLSSSKGCTPLDPFDTLSRSTTMASTGPQPGFNRWPPPGPGNSHSLGLLL